MEMHRMQIPLEGDDGSWRQRCYYRMERLKAREFPMSEEPHSHPQEIFGATGTEIFEMQKIVQNGNVDSFVDVLEQLSLEKKLALSTIFGQVTATDDSLLHVAAYFGKVEIAELIGHHFPKLLIKTNIKRDTPLHVAATGGSVGVIKVILSQYEAAYAHNSPSSPELITRLTNEYENTALHEAVESKHDEAISLLFEADNRVAHYTNKSKKSPLYLAVLSSNKKIVNLLLQAPFPDPLPKCHGNSPLHAAIYTKNADLLKEIMNNRSDLMYLRDEDGGTPLHYAAAKGYVEGAQMILKKSTFTALQWNIKGHFPIHLACKWDRVEMLKEFLKPEWTDSRVLYNRKSQSILHVAANNGSVSVVIYLLGKKELMQSILNKKDKDGNTALHLAAENVFPHILFFLTVRKNIDLNIINNKGYTARDILLVKRGLPSSFRQRSAMLMLEANHANKSDKGESDAHKQRVVPSMEKWLQDKVSALMVVVALIVTVTFAAGFTLPGGVHSSDEHDQQKRGMAVLSKNQLFKAFVAMDWVAMYSAILASIALFWAHGTDFSYEMISWKVANFLVRFAMASMNAAFMSALGLVLGNVPLFANLILITGVISSLLILNFGYLVSFYVIGSIGRFILIIPYLIHKPIKEKKRKPQSSPSDSEQAPQAGTLEEAA